MKPGIFNYPHKGNLGGLFNFPRQGNLRRVALRDAAEQTRRLKAFVRQVCPAAEPKYFFGFDVASTRPDTSVPALITDISQFGSTWCSKHQLITVGNFCSACEQEAANSRVPVRNPAPVAPSYGTCPVCGAPGIDRERCPGGNDHCSAGHTYPSRESVASAQSVSNDSSGGHADKGQWNMAVRVHSAMSRDPDRPVTVGGQGVKP